VTTLKKLTAYYIAMGMAGLSNVGKNLIYAKILGPEGLGFYSLSILFSTFAMYVCSGGLYEGAMGLFPMMYGESRDGEVRRMRNIAAAGIILFSAALLLAGGLAGLILPFRSWSFRAAVILGISLAGAQIFFVFVLADLRSRMLTTRFGYFILVRSLMSLIFGVLAARRFGFTGVLLSETVIPLILSVFAIRWGTLEFRISMWRPDLVRPLFRLGVPLILNGALTTTGASLDKIFIVAALGAAAFGQYSFAMLLVTGAMMLQAIIYQHVGPLILYRIGGGANPLELLHKLDRYVLFALGGFLVLWYPFTIGIKIAIGRFFPQYLNAVPVLVILYLGGCFALVNHYEHFMIAAKKPEAIIALNVGIILLVAALLGIGMIKHEPLVWFAGVFVGGRAASLLGMRSLAGWSVSRLSYY
jgi:O-antigen/teichoic acid export membrane protein